MKKWITFGMPKKSDSGKTLVWEVVNAGGTALGQIKWNSMWRRYAFYPLAFTLYEQDCLRSIADFCESASKTHRANRKSR